MTKMAQVSFESVNKISDTRKRRWPELVSQELPAVCS